MLHSESKKAFVYDHNSYKNQNKIMLRKLSSTPFDAYTLGKNCVNITGSITTGHSQRTRRETRATKSYGSTVV